MPRTTSRRVWDRNGTCGKRCATRLPTGELESDSQPTIAELAQCNRAERLALGAGWLSWSTGRIIKILIIKILVSWIESGTRYLLR